MKNDGSSPNHRRSGQQMLDEIPKEIYISNIKVSAYKLMEEQWHSDEWMIDTSVIRPIDVSRWSRIYKMSTSVFNPIYNQWSSKAKMMNTSEPKMIDGQQCLQGVQRRSKMPQDVNYRRSRQPMFNHFPGLPNVCPSTSKPTDVGVRSLTFKSTTIGVLADICQSFSYRYPGR